MKNVLTVSALVLFLNTPALAIEAHQSHEHHKGAPSANVEVKSGTKYTSDDALKPLMEKILGTMKSLYAHGDEKKIGKVKAAGVTVEKTVQEIFKNCKLEPAADAAIHPILAGILEGASLLKKGKADEGHDKVHQALIKYEGLFIHPGWNENHGTSTK